MPGFEASDHHHIIAGALEAVERGEIDRLLIEAPPRHTKSELGSRRFPSWFLGKHPTKQIISATYSGDFALDFGREVRNIVNSASYQSVFDTRLSEDSRAANRWHTTDGGIYVSVGIGGPITGRGAHIALIDDPFKNRQEADSELNRNTVWNWYSSTLRTRLMPGGAIILILTRWHEDDLAGRLIKEQGDRWHRVKLQAISGEGTDNEQALWPAWYPLEALKDIKSEITHRDWEALYQQSPTPDEGTFFKREWFKRFKLGDEPKVNNYQSSDFAVTEDTTADFTELANFGIDAQDELWITDWWYGQTTSDKWIDSQLDMIQNHKPFAVFGETGQIRRAVEPFQKMRAKQRKIYPRWEWISRSGDKVAMARAFQGMASMGMVHIPLCDWGERLIDQLVAFPAGANDHSVDVCALMGMAINMAHPAIVPVCDDKTKNQDGYWADDDEDESWLTS